MCITKFSLWSLNYHLGAFSKNKINYQLGDYTIDSFMSFYPKKSLGTSIFSSVLHNFFFKFTIINFCVDVISNILGRCSCVIVTCTSR